MYYTIYLYRSTVRPIWIHLTHLTKPGFFILIQLILILMIKMIYETLPVWPVSTYMFMDVDVDAFHREFKS